MPKLDQAQPDAPSLAPMPSEALSSESWRLLAQPALAGLTGRFAHLALTGQLYVDEGSISRAMAKTGSPVAEQVLATMRELKGQDWRFLKVPREYGGYHIEAMRDIVYSTSGWRGELQHIVGAGKGPINEAAVLFSHEVGHYDADRLRYPIPSSDVAGTLLMTKRAIIDETRALVVEAHMGQELGVTSLKRQLRQEKLLAALQSGTLGEFITTVTYPRYGVVPRDEANRLVNDYLKETYGGSLIDASSGKVRSFNIRAGFGANNIAPLPGDAEAREILQFTNENYLRTRAYPSNTIRNPKFKGSPCIDNMLQKTEFLRTGQGKAATVFGHGTRALAAVGLLVAANDIAGKYGESFGAGNGRVTRVAADWAGYEAGLGLAGATVKALAVRNPWAVAAISLAAGVGVSDGFDIGLGQRMETVVSKL